MAQPYVGEIRLFAGNFAPVGWEFCAGQLLPIAENVTLFQLIGTTYGGDGEFTFALPDLRGRVPINQGNGYSLAAIGGVEEVTLTIQQIPSHSHPLMGSADFGQESGPQGKVFARSASMDAYTDQVTQVPANAQAVSPVGGSQPHTNFQPYVCINYIISMFGIFPSPT